MFEDSTFESNGRIKTRSRRWMLATLALNGSVLLALILIPLIYPQALPQLCIPVVMAAPSGPIEKKPEPRPEARVFHGEHEMHSDGSITAPSRIPNSIANYKDRETEEPMGIAAEIGGGTVIGASSDVFHARRDPVVHTEEKKVRISGAIAAGYLIFRKVPVYPELARAMRAEGTVVLAAIISKTGAIENLHVVSGPAVLQQAALDAVKQWRYRPYLLSGDPVEVETTVNVIFTMGR